MGGDRDAGDDEPRTDEDGAAAGLAAPPGSPPADEPADPWTASAALEEERPSPLEPDGDDDVPPAAAPEPWGRVLATLLVPGLILLLGNVPLAGVDVPLFEHAAAGYLRSHLISQVSVGVLTIWPLVSTFVIVEVLALLVPAGRRLRLSGPAGRARLAFVAWILGAALALVEGVVLATNLGQMSFQGIPIVAESGGTFVAGTALSITTAVLLTGYAARWSTERGLIDGFSAAIATHAAVELFTSVREGLEHDAGAELSVDTAVLQRIAMLAFVAALTWVLLAGRGRAAAPVRGGMRVPDLASGMLPLRAIAFTVQLVWAYARAGSLPPELGPDGTPPGSVAYIALELVAACGAAVLLAWLFNAPGRVAEVYARATGTPTTPERQLTARALTAAAAARSVVFFALLVLVPSVLFRGQGLQAEELVGMITLTAVALDVREAWRAHRRHTDLVPVWPEPRPYAVRAALHALAAAGIRGYARSRHHRAVLQIAGAAVPTELMVASADRDRASAILERALGPA